MRRYQKLLVGLSVDDSGQALSAGSRRAVEEALWLAGRSGGTVTLFHALGDEESGATAVGAEVEGSEAERIAPAPVAQFAAELRAKHPNLGFAVASGPAWVAISRRVLRGQADFVVVAKRNALGAASRRLGTVAARLVRACPSPVWVVHGGRPFPHKNVLAATALEPVGELATQLGAWFADEMDANLELVHAWQMPMELEMQRASLSSAEFQMRVQAITESAAAQVRAGLGGYKPKRAPKLHVGCDAPSRAILELVERYSVDLLVLGTIGRGGLPGALIGNTAERLLHEVDCSLLTVKPDGFVSPVTLD